MPQRRKKSSRKHRPHQRTTSPSNAIVRVAAPVEKPWELDNEQVTILKNAVAKGATDEELKYCLTVARRYRLDPFKRQIWFVSRWDKNADNGKGGSGTFVWTPTVGIDGLLFMSARDHAQDFGSVSLPEYGPMYKPECANFMAPEWAKVKVFKKGVAEPTEAIAYFDEYCPSDFSKAPFWRKMPRRMIGKCASALALRQAYPDLGGLYIPEECDRIAEDYTPSGRQIIAPGDQRPSAEANESISILKAKGLWCDEHNCIRNGRHLETCVSSRQAMQKPPIEAQPALDWKKEAEKKADEAAKPKPAKKEPPKPIETKYSLTIDWSLDRNAPVLTGQVSELVGFLPKDVTLEWKGDLWHAQAKDIPAIMQAAGQNSFLVKEIQPNQVPPGGQQSVAPPPARKPADRAGAVTSSAAPSAGPSIVSGTIERLNTGMAGRNPVKHVTLLLADKTKPTYSCFDKKWFEHLDAGLGKAARLVTKQNGKYTNIVGALQIGSKEWLEDGTPVVRRDREAGGKTLF